MLSVFIVLYLTLGHILLQAIPYLVGCPACLRNYLNLFCELSCSPNQSLFINVNSVSEVRLDPNTVKLYVALILHSPTFLMFLVLGLYAQSVLLVVKLNDRCQQILPTVNVL
jgi:hypothetical protein